MSLLRHLAVSQTYSDFPELRYDANTQTSQVFEDGRWVDSWRARRLQGTKKKDIETGEDNKGE